MRAYSKTINRNTRQNEEEYMDRMKEVHKIFRQNKRVVYIKAGEKGNCL